MILAVPHQNLKLLKKLARLHGKLLIIPCLISLPVLVAWLAPAVQSLLPNGWELMKANTALCILLSTCAMWLTHFQTNPTRRLAGQLLGAAVLIVAGSTLAGHITNLSFALDTILAKDSLASAPGRMSVQTALFFFVLGFSIICEGRNGAICTQVRDIVCALLITLLLTVIAGYLYGASSLFEQASDVRTSPQTLVCMLCLAGALLIARVHHGYFSILAGFGIGSRISRVVLPIALLLPFLMISSSAWLSHGRGLSPALASALTTAFTAAMLFVVLIWLSGKINEMESELRDITLIDDLTKINNRRGFYLLGEHMLYQAQREERTLTVMFFDLDGLKEINDTLGHDIGSNLLKHFATLLRQNFRKSDLVARLGGDEFAVVSSGGDSQIALKRLERIVQATNKAGQRPYIIRYSVGDAAISANSSIRDFNELVSTADERMYERKRAKKATDKPSSPVAKISPAPVSESTP